MDRARLDIERKLFEAYAGPKGYNLARMPADKYDVFKSAYKLDAVEHQWQGWMARAELHATIETGKPRRSAK